MRKAVMIFVVFLALFVLAPQIFAQVLVEKPELPQGYESWPYQLKHSCGDLTENMYGIIFGKEKKTVAYVIVSSIDGKVFAFRHEGGNLEKPYFLNRYVQKNSQWLKFNPLDAKEKQASLDEFFNTLKQFGMSELSYFKNCEKFDNETDSFFDWLREELSKK